MVTVGEMSSTTIANCIRYTNPREHELSMTFSFHHLKVDYKNGDKWSLMAPDIHKLKEIFASWQEGMAAGGGWNAVFWCNHDQPRIVSRLGDTGKYWKESAKMLAAAIHLMRGTPYIYQGEEIGMTNADFTDIADYRDVESINYHGILRDIGRHFSVNEMLSLDHYLQRNSRCFSGRVLICINRFCRIPPYLLVCENYSVLLFVYYTISHLISP